MQRSPCVSFAVLGLALITAAQPASGRQGFVSDSPKAGPIGDGWAFSQASRAETEARLVVTRSYGTERLGDDRLRSERARETVEAAASFGVGQDFYFRIFGHATLEAFEASTSEASHEESADFGEQEVGAGPMVGFGNLRLGGAVALLQLQEANFVVEEEGEEAKSRWKAAALPIMRLHGSWEEKTWSAGAFLRLYNDVSSTLTTETDDATVSADAKRRRAGRFGLGASWHPDTRLTLGIDFDQVGHRQAEGKSASDAMSLAVGGAFRPEWWFEVSAGYRYAEPSYRSEADASLARDDLGGSTIDVGATYDMATANVHGGLAYTIPSPVTYDLAPDERDGWQAEGGEVTVERSIWTATVGGLWRW
jgi:hypothetical protein